MYFTQLPDHSSPGFDEQLHFSRFKKQNIIFNAQSRHASCDLHVGCLSFKTITRGEEEYTIDGRQIVLRPGQFLILNDDQPYGCRIRNGESTKVFSVFFQKEFAQAVLTDARNTETTSLDDPFNQPEIPNFYQTLTTITPQFQRQLNAFITQLETQPHPTDAKDEYLLFLLRHLIQTHNATHTQMKSVAALKPATKEAIFKRLCIARDKLHSSYDEPLDLQTLSRTSCLSIPQLVRQFKTVFHTTPHRYLTHIRMQHAAHLLRTTGDSIGDITQKSGFEDASAFRRAFKSAHGLQPEAFRRSKQPIS
jgi:AraC family transcriptional regulator